MGSLQGKESMSEGGFFMKKIAQILFPFLLCLVLFLLKGSFELSEDCLVYAETAQQSGEEEYSQLNRYSHIHDEVLAEKTYLVLAPQEANPMKNCLKELTKYPLEHLTLEFRAGREYEILLKIVEAEAGGEPIAGKILVANVVLNRVNSPEFPDCVEDVVYQVVEGSPQFTPVADGRIDSVVISDQTVEAVNRALDGEDESQGALYFMSGIHSEEKNVCWFRNNLTWLFSCGGHDFYR